MSDMKPRMNLSPHTPAMVPTVITKMILIGKGNPAHTNRLAARTTPKMNLNTIVTMLT